MYLIVDTYQYIMILVFSDRVYVKPKCENPAHPTTDPLPFPNDYQCILTLQGLTRLAQIN